MKYISYLVCFLLLLLDVLILIFLLLFPKYWKEVFVIHTIISIITIQLIKNTLQTFRGIPIYLILFMPVLGSIIVFILYFSLSYFMRESIVLSDYEALIEFNNTLDFKEKINYNKEIRTMSFLDMLDALDSEEKKQLIIDSEIIEYQGKVKLLQKGLSDYDTEVQHYSATLINDKENDFTNRINFLREKYNQEKDHLTLRKLSDTYRQYINSDLVRGEMFYVFNREYIETLVMLLNINEKDIDVLDSLVKAHIRNNDFINANTINELLLIRFPNNSEGIVNKLNISFEKDSLSEFNLLINSLTENEIKSSKKVENLVSFWTKKEVKI